MRVGRVGGLPGDGKGGGDEPGLGGRIRIDGVRQVRGARPGVSVGREANEEWVFALRAQVGGASRAGDGQAVLCEVKSVM